MWLFQPIKLQQSNLVIMTEISGVFLNNIPKWLITTKSYFALWVVSG